MHGSPQFTPPSWNGADSIRETTLICIDDPAYREALRQVGRMIYEMAIETTQCPGDESITHAELRAALAELRFIEGFFDSMVKSAEALPPSDARLARFAGRLARHLGALAALGEGEL
jgi:hypothetical protein